MVVRPHRPVTPDEADTLRRIILALGALTHAFGEALADPELAGLSSNADIVVLSSLDLTGPQRPRELIDRTGLTAGGLSNLFERLEGRELIARTYGCSDDDRRSALVSLTPRGAQLVAAISDAIRRTMTEQSALLHRTRDLIDSISDPPTPKGTPDRGVAPLEQVHRLARLGMDLAASLAEASRADGANPSQTTLVLCAAATPDGTRPRDLLGLTDLSSGGISLLLDRVERAGLIRRVTGRDPDRRSVTVTLTDLGRADLGDRLARAAHHLPEIRSLVAVADGETPLDRR